MEVILLRDIIGYCLVIAELLTQDTMEYIFGLVLVKEFVMVLVSVCEQVMLFMLKIKETVTEISRMVQDGTRVRALVVNISGFDLVVLLN